MPDAPHIDWREFYRPHLGASAFSSAIISGSEWWPVRCILPDHGGEDSNASAGISKKTGRIHCFKCGKTVTPLEFLTDILDPPLDTLAAIEAVDIFRKQMSGGTLPREKEDYFTNQRPSYNPAFEQLIRRAHELMSPDREEIVEYMAARNLKYETLLRKKVGWLPGAEVLNRKWGRDSVVFPYYINNRVVGIRYRDSSLTKSGETNSHFIPWGIDDLDDPTETVLLVEGESDCLALLQAVDWKYTVLAVPGSEFRREWQREFEGVRQVILIPQSDEASQTKLVPAVRAALDNVTVLPLPWQRKQVGNDIADWLRYNSPERIARLIDAAAEPSTRRVLTGAEFRAYASHPRDWLIRNVLARRQVCLIGGSPKSFKCVAGDTLIELADGDVRPASDLLADKRPFEIVSFDPTSLKRSVNTARVTDNGVHHLVRIELASGRVIRRTLNHPLVVANAVGPASALGGTDSIGTGDAEGFPSPFKWVSAGDIKAGQQLLQAAQSPTWGKVELDPADLEYILLHYVYGGGYHPGARKPNTMALWINPTGPRIWSNRKRITAESNTILASKACEVRIVRGFGVGPRRKYKQPRYEVVASNPSGIVQLKRLHRVYDAYLWSHVDRVPRLPPIVYQLVPEQLVYLLKRILELRRDPATLVPWKATYPHKSYDAARMTQILLWKLGIAAKITEGFSVIVAKESLQSFNQQVLQQCVEPKLLGHTLDKVVRVAVEVPQPTVAISVAKDHTYISPDALEHNTWCGLNIIRSVITDEPLFGIPGLVAPERESEADIPRILFVEEEGDAEGFMSRLESSLKGVEWDPYLFIGHHLGVKLDTDVWVERLGKYIEDLNISLLLLDPFSRTYSVDEDSAAEMGQVWNRIAQLTTRFRNLSIIVIHHFSKSGSIEGGWNSFRGSSRTAAEADLGIFMEAATQKQGGGAMIRFDGRSIPPIVAQDGSEVFHLRFDHGLLIAGEAMSAAAATNSVQQAIEDKGFILLKDAYKLLGTTSSKEVHDFIEGLKAADGRPLYYIDRNVRPAVVRRYNIAVDDFPVKPRPVKEPERGSAITIDARLSQIISRIEQVGWIAVSEVRTILGMGQPSEVRVYMDQVRDAQGRKVFAFDRDVNPPAFRKYNEAIDGRDT
jgi:hypothetical protein